MFGFVICDKKGIDKAELARYRSFYCGICRKLSEYGQAEKLALNYDMTFVALFLSSLYEPEESISRYRCAVHPLTVQKVLDNPYVQYAADMTVALSYHKSLDDWIDDHKVSAKKYADSIKDSYEIIREAYPRQCIAIEKSLDELHLIEADPASSADDAICASGRMLSEVFAYKEDFWAEELRQFGYFLGRFIYLMDATVDYDKDLKSGSYNPLRIMDRTPKEMDELLRMEIGEAADIFERLPIVNDVHLLRNIIYSGVWLKYDAHGLSLRQDKADYQEGIMKN